MSSDTTAYLHNVVHDAMTSLISYDAYAKNYEYWLAVDKLIAVRT